MSIARNRTRSKPSPTRKTVVLFDSTKPRRMPGFARGLSDEPPISVADLAAAWQMAGEDDGYDWDEDDHFDVLAAEAAMQDRAERGFINGDLAEYLSQSSLVGHRP